MYNNFSALQSFVINRYCRPEGNIFEVEAKEYEDMHLKRGDIVTFAYENYSRHSIPVRPKIMRKRTDLSWEEVVKSSAHTLPQNLNGTIP